MDGVETGPYEIRNKVTGTSRNFNVARTQVAKLTGPYVEMGDLRGWGEIYGIRQYKMMRGDDGNDMETGHAYPRAELDNAGISLITTGPKYTHRYRQLMVCLRIWIMAKNLTLTVTVKNNMPRLMRRH